MLNDLLKAFFLDRYPWTLSGSEILRSCSRLFRYRLDWVTHFMSDWFFAVDTFSDSPLTSIALTEPSSLIYWETRHCSVRYSRYYACTLLQREMGIDRTMIIPCLVRSKEQTILQSLLLLRLIVVLVVQTKRFSYK